MGYEMMRSAVRSGILAIVLWGIALLGTAAPVAAECSALDPWPSFREAARTAGRIVLGEVVAAYDYDSADNATTFKLRVDEVLRGRSGRFIEFRDGVKSGLPLRPCPGDSILRVRLGYVIALAFDARVGASPRPVLAVAFIHGVPDEFLLPGVERLTLNQVRSLAALPPTDTAGQPPPPTGSIAVIPLAVAAVLGAVVALLRMRRYAS
jgi:hypothetical protein